jgi:hypothetical protein
MVASIDPVESAAPSRQGRQTLQGQANRRSGELVSFGRISTRLPGRLTGAFTGVPGSPSIIYREQRHPCRSRCRAQCARLCPLYGLGASYRFHTSPAVADRACTPRIVNLLHSTHSRRTRCSGMQDRRGTISAHLANYLTMLPNQILLLWPSPLVKLLLPFRATNG